MALPDFSDFNIDDDDMLMHEAIHQIGPEFGFDDPLFALLKEEFKSSMISVTDAGGNFQIVLNKDQMKPWRHIIATKQDFMGAKQQLVLHSREEASGSGLKDLFTPDEQGYVTIPPLKIFPAGMIIIEPIVPDKFIEELNQSTANQWRPRGTLSWFKFGHERPPWFEAMGDYTHPSRNNGASLFYKRDLLLNAEQKVYVASELEITFRVNVLEERGRGELEPIVIPNIKLRQGEVLNIGRVEFGSALQVAVKVVDSKGRGVEGVTVRHKDEAGLGGSEGITAADGIALLNIPRYSRGEFFVQNRFEYMPDDLFQKPLAEGISYIVGGEEDAGRVFILPLSDNFLALLFN
ncbi:MAG: hypothetical protein A2167_05090 [Planctomycetes bacterium RBG_13_46_10]|nr:MAG: hypothetical protein A2167_05090 [Planctomycetes bacterium RBG_13_46_10]